jgi:putative hydrolase of the HAD superfamily
LSAFAGRDVWVFDLDNTLYPADHEVFGAIGDRMTAFISRTVGVERDAALALRETYFNDYGATVVGLVKHHGVDAAAFLHEVHDVSLDAVEPDPELGGLIARLSGRRIVFTNGGRDYAHRILARLDIDRVFDSVFALEDTGLAPKPERAAFERLIKSCNFDPARAVMFEDHLRNLEPAAELGFATVLVGAATPPAPYVHHAAPRLHAFLRAVLDNQSLTAAPASPSERG